MVTADQALADLIRQTIRANGPVTFAWFMEQALYHPELGYYSSGRCQIGRRGDYFTNVSVGPLFGRMLAAQFAEMWEMLGRPADFTIVEQGAHHGDFARDVLGTLRDARPDCFSALRYSVVEPFPILRTRQEEALGEFSGKVGWSESLKELPEFTGVHFSNELLDAMPVRLITRDGEGEWQERMVVEAGEDFQFVPRLITDENLRAHLPDLPPAGTGTYDTEINLAALDWVERVAGKLERGFVLAVDYGFPRAEFFAPERNEGTLQGYARHRTVSSPLQDIGRADIASHVEWTSLAERAEECGLTIVGFTDQHHFMTGMLSLVSPREDERPALQTLIHPEFLGTRFQYLALGRNVPSLGLTGFRFARDPRKLLGS
jgi:SAM-dependent MidA family methyltransferase